MIEGLNISSFGFTNPNVSGCSAITSALPLYEITKALSVEIMDLATKLESITSVLWYLLMILLF
jgi:hypothetical protein